MLQSEHSYDYFPEQTQILLSTFFKALGYDDDRFEDVYDKPSKIKNDDILQIYLRTMKLKPVMMR